MKRKRNIWFMYRGNNIYYISICSTAFRLSINSLTFISTSLSFLLCSLCILLLKLWIRYCLIATGTNSLILSMSCLVGKICMSFWLAYLITLLTSDLMWLILLMIVFICMVFVNNWWDFFFGRLDPSSDRKKILPMVYVVGLVCCSSNINTYNLSFWFVCATVRRTNLVLAQNEPQLIVWHNLIGAE